MKAVTDTKYYDEIARAIMEYGGSQTETLIPSQMADGIRLSQENAHMEGFTDGKIAALESEKTTDMFYGSYTITDGVNKPISSLNLDNTNGLDSVTIEFTDETESFSQYVEIALYGGTADYLIYENGRVVKGNIADEREEDITETSIGQEIIALCTYEGITSITCNASCQIGYTKSVLKEQHDKGRQAQYDEFWDALQNNGESVSYQYAFGGERWSDATFKPKYDLKGTSFYRCFHSSEIKTIDKVIDASKATAVGQMFYQAAIENITHLIMPNLTSYSQMFQTCTALKNITVSGTIGANIDFSASSNLTPSSVDSIIGTLKQLAEGDDARTVTFHKTVKNNMTDSQKAIIQEKGWTLA